MQLLSVPAPRTWVEAASYTDHLFTTKSGARSMSGLSRSGSKSPTRSSTKRTFLLTWVVLFGMVICQGTRLHSPSIGNATNITPTTVEDPSSLLVQRLGGYPSEAFWDGWDKYDPPEKAPGLTDEEFNETWRGLPNTLKIGVLMPFTLNKEKPYRKTMSRINLSVLRMAAKDMNDRQVIPGMNISLVLRDSQRLMPNTNVSGAASAISATTRLLSQGVGGVIGDVASELTMAEAIMTSSVGVPQCAFSSYNMDSEFLSNFSYLFRTAPTVMKFVGSLTYVIHHYGWKRISLLHTTDVTGILGEKLISKMCNEMDIDVLDAAIQLPDDDKPGDSGSLLQHTLSALRTIQYSDTRIHIVIAARTDQVTILDIVRNSGLFQKDHVWLTPVDLSDSIALLENPADFNGLIMADVLWELPGLPAYDNFVTNWINLDPKKYPLSGSTQLTWHETFAYTCLQIIVEGYRALVQNVNIIANETIRETLLKEIRRGERSQDLTIPFLGNRSYNTPTGQFTLDEDGDPAHSRISILSFQNSTSVPNGQFVNGAITIFNPIVFKDGTTKVPKDAPSWDELNPQSSSPFGITILILSSILLLAIISTAIIVIVNRDNIIIKSASPLFCVLELLGLAITLTWIYMRADVPTPGICRTGLMVVIIGLTINLSALVVKNYRIYRIFNSARIINHAVSNKYLLRVVAIPVVITMIPCIIHCFIHYLQPDLIRTNNDQFWVQCSSSDSQYAWDIIIGITPLILTLFGVYLAFKTRNVTRLWNEARAIATTIYTVTFFIIIVIIVQTFPQTLYQISYHVTIVCIFVGCFLEYCILFIPKLRNLWLQKRGLHVAAGREGDMLDSVLGGINASVGRRGGMSNASHVDESTQDDFTKNREKLYGPTAGMLFSERRSSDISEAHTNMNISDLVSSYPFGQINNDNGTTSITSPIHQPTIFGHSILSKQGRKAMGSQDGNMDSLDLSEAPHPLSGGPSISSGGNSSAADGDLGENSQVKTGGYGIFGGTQTNTARSSRDIQPSDLHEILLASSNNRTSIDHSDSHRTNGVLTVNGGGGSGGLGFLVDSDRDLYSRKSSFGDFDHAGPGKVRSGAFTGAPAEGSRNKSPKLYPLQNQSSRNGGHSSMKSRMRETRMDSYTVVVPVQRQRWYIMKVLAQWRMSKIIFVPYSKVLVIVDLETEKSFSLILHSIEAGYSPSVDHVLKTSTSERPTGAADSLPQHSHLPTTLARNSSDQSARTIQFSNQIAPAVHLSPGFATKTRLASEDTIGRQVLPDAVLNQPSPTGVDTSPVPDTIIGTEPVEIHTSLRRRASQQMMSNMKNMALNLGLDMRQMDGTTPSYEDNLTGIEEGIQTDYVIRVISIHNECWRVQLPDQETMDRWVEIGQKIKDDNWITRPLNGGLGLISTRRDPSDGPSSGGTEEDSYPSGGSSVGQGQPSRSPNHNRTLHPLQHRGSSDNGQEHSQRPRKDERWMSDVTDSSTSSNEMDRQLVRERAARMNQQLKATNRLHSPSLRGLQTESVRSGSSGPTLEIPQGMSGPYSIASRWQKKPATHSSLSRIVTLPVPPNEHDGIDMETYVTLSEPSTAVPGEPHNMSADSPDPSQFIRRRTEETDLREILAETNIAYNKGQHAVYDDHDPATAYRGHRFFNNLQYNYNRGRFQDGEVPQSPEWHLTTLELAQMESERTLTGSVPDVLLDNSEVSSADEVVKQHHQQQQPSTADPVLTSPVPMVSVTAPPETMTSPWPDPSPHSEPFQDSREAAPHFAPPLNLFVSMSPMVMHLPPTFPKYSSPGEGQADVSAEERTSGLIEESQAPAQLLENDTSQDHATLDNNSDTGMAGQ